MQPITGVSISSIDFEVSPSTRKARTRKFAVRIEDDLRRRDVRHQQGRYSVGDFIPVSSKSVQTREVEHCTMRESRRLAAVWLPYALVTAAGGACTREYGSAAGAMPAAALPLAVAPLGVQAAEVLFALVVRDCCATPSRVPEAYRNRVFSARDHAPDEAILHRERHEQWEEGRKCADLQVTASSA